MRRPASHTPPAYAGGVSPSNPLGNVQRETEFFSRYRAGQLTNLADFKEAVRLQRLHNDATNTSFERFSKMDLGPFNYAAPQRLAYPSHFNSHANLVQNDRADWQHVDPDVMLFAANVIEVFRRMHIPLFVHSAFRTRTEQNALLAKGATKAAWPRAAHCQGAAVDIVHGLYAWNLTKPEWDLLGIIGKDVNARMNRQRKVADRFTMEWGGDWRFYDPAHWEKVGWKDHLNAYMVGDPVRRTPRSILSK